MMNRLIPSFWICVACSFLHVSVQADTATKKSDPTKKKPLLISHLYGTWYGESKTKKSSEYYLITRTSDKIFMSKMMYVNHKKKHYAIDTDSGKWSLRNNVFKEVYKNLGVEEPDVMTYQVINLTDKKFVYWVTHEGKEKFTETKSNLKVLPKPPKGYKEVDLDTYYEDEEDDENGEDDE